MLNLNILLQRGQLARLHQLCGRVYSHFNTVISQLHFSFFFSLHTVIVVLVQDILMSKKQKVIIETTFVNVPFGWIKVIPNTCQVWDGQDWSETFVLVMMTIRQTCQVTPVGEVTWPTGGHIDYLQQLVSVLPLDWHRNNSLLHDSWCCSDCYCSRNEAFVSFVGLLYPPGHVTLASRHAQSSE